MTDDSRDIFVKMLKDVNQSLRDKLDRMTNMRKDMILSLDAIWNDHYINCTKCNDDWNDMHCPPNDAHDEFIKMKNAIAVLLENETGNEYQKEDE